MSATELMSQGFKTVAKAAEFTTVCRTNQYMAMEAGELPYILKGNRRMIPTTALIEWMAEGLIAPQNATSREGRPVPATA